jgi:multiple sugar transport system substrate-binding protein
MEVPMSGRLPLWRAWLAAIAAGALLLAGCGGSDESDDADGGAETEEGAEGEQESAEAVELHFEWWGNDERAELTEQAIELFTEEHPNITVTTAFATFVDYWPAMNTKIAGGDAPDVLQMDYTYLREYAERGVLADLSGQADVDGVLPALLEGGTLDGSLYGVPMGRNLMSFQYDPVIWEEAGLEPPEAGWTWQDYLDAAVAITESTGGDPLGTSGFGQHVTMFEVWLIQQGKALYTDDGQLGFTRDDLVAWWEQEQAFFDAGAAATSPRPSCCGTTSWPARRPPTAPSWPSRPGPATPATWAPTSSRP